jgi:hypothetical protein
MEIHNKKNEDWLLKQERELKDDDYISFPIKQIWKWMNEDEWMRRVTDGCYFFFLWVNEFPFSSHNKCRVRFTSGLGPIVFFSINPNKYSKSLNTIN